MTRREKLRQNTLEEIKAIARRQMAENGTAAISLKSIARAMEISGPALYRYYASRDELVTALIVDAYNDLAGAMERAPAGFDREDYGGRLLAAVLAYREWALAHPIDFQLIFGNPIPGYHAPAEVTLPAASRSFAVILNILSDAAQAGVLKPQPGQVDLPPGLRAAFNPRPGGETPDQTGPAVYIDLVGWSRIHGIIMLEMFHHIQGVVSDTGLFYRHEVDQLLSSVGLYPREG